MKPFKLLYSAADGRPLFEYGAYATIPAAAAATQAAEAIRRGQQPSITGGTWRAVPADPIKFTPALCILSAETMARQAQKAIDELDSLKLPDQWGDVDIAGLRSELTAEREEYASEAAYWRSQLDQQTT